MLIWLIRAVYVGILAGLAAKITSDYGDMFAHGQFGAILLFFGILGGGLLVVLIDLVYPEKRIRNISAIYFGLLVGSLLGHLLSLAFGPTLTLWSNARFNLGVPFSLVTTTILCYVCVSVLLQTKDDFRFVIPYVEFSRQIKGARPLILDSSVIIDGRIADIAETGLLDQTLVVPRFVLQELQSVADSSEKFKKSRGRHGLGVLDRLQKCPHVRVEMQVGEPLDSRIRAQVDDKLIELAKGMNGKILTNDVNLAKMAGLQGIETVNLNEVGKASRPPVLWGETLAVRLVREGEEPGQGIGYLEDGTMVVAEAGKNFVGHEVNLVVTSVLQTNAGRMIFGRLDSRQPEPARVVAARGN